MDSRVTQPVQSLAHQTLSLPDVQLQQDVLRAEEALFGRLRWRRVQGWDERRRGGKYQALRDEVDGPIEQLQQTSRDAQSGL